MSQKRGATHVPVSLGLAPNGKPPFAVQLDEPAHRRDAVADLGRLDAAAASSQSRKHQAAPAAASPHGQGSTPRFWSSQPNLTRSWTRLGALAHAAPVIEADDITAR
jgi:hypothetical protein